jgi:hypothetical protein
LPPGPADTSPCTDAGWAMVASPGNGRSPEAVDPPLPPHCANNRLQLMICMSTARAGPVSVPVISVPVSTRPWPRPKPLVLPRRAVLSSPAVFTLSAIPAGFIAPCLPIKAAQPPSGGLWLHEIKHDGFRVIARKDGNRVRLYSQPGNDLTWRFPLIVEAVARLRSRSCIIDGEAVACDANGVPSFDRLRYRRDDGRVFLYAFDLIELDGDDLRREPLEVRKATLRSVLAKASPGLRLNEPSRLTGQSSLPMPARWDWKASSRNGRIRATAPAAAPTG